MNAPVPPGNSCSAGRGDDRTVGRGAVPSARGGPRRRWLVALATGLLACTAPVVRGTGGGVEAQGVVLSGAPPLAIDRLPMPPLDAPWRPPRVVAGNPEPLAAVLHDAAQLRVVLGPRLDGAMWRRRLTLALATMDVAAAPQFLPSQSVAAALPLPLPAVAPADAGALTLLPSFVAGLRAAAGDGLVLVIDDAVIDEAAWRASPAQTTGSCDAPLQVLARGQEQGLAQLEPFLDWADAALWSTWRAALRERLPALQRRLAPYAPPRQRRDFVDEDTWREHECGHASAQWLEHYVHCAAAPRPCEWAPRLLLVGGAKVAAAEPSVFVPEGCPAAVAGEVRTSVREAARFAARSAGAAFDPQAITLADRLARITDVHAALDDVCAPRRRRFAAADLADARARLGAIGRALASSEPPAPSRWRVFDAADDGPAPGLPFHVPGLGPVHEFARFDVPASSPAARVTEGAKALRQFVLSRALCRSGQPLLPLAVMLVDPRAGAVKWFGYLYDETLACGELPPAGWDDEAVVAP